jgi:hypothetical protein
VSVELLESDSPAIYPVDQGGEQREPVERLAGLGSPIRFKVWLRYGLLRPAWAALCGALASGGMTLSTEPLLQLAILMFLVDVIWGGLWSGLAATDWATPLYRWQSWRRGNPVRLLPYTSPNAPAGHFARTWGQLRSWWHELAQPSLGPTLSALVLLLPLALVIAALLGVLPFLITLAAIALLQILFAITGGDAHPQPSPQALFEISLPWLAGHALFAAPTLASALVALAYGLSYAGGLRLTQNQPGLARWNLGQIIAVVVLVVLHQPVAAGIAGLLFLVQALLEPGLFDEETEQVIPAAVARFLRSARPWLMAAMLVTAWGLGAASSGG